jgi:uncharacterized protein (DUF952 family)
MTRYPDEGSHAMTEWVYKIARKPEWDEVDKSGSFTGSVDDKRDGFIHLSAAHQVRATCDKYFAGENNLLLVALDAKRLDPSLKWEESRGGEKFPHLYGALPIALVHCVVPIRREDNGRPIFPPEIP